LREVRRLVREARQQGMNVLILVDPIDPDSLRGTRLQGTLLRARRSLRNLAVTRERCSGLLRTSGKHCPRCGCKGKEAQHTKRSRIYECPRCHLKWDRDKGSLYNLAYSYFARMIREESDDLTVLATRVLEALGMAGKAPERLKTLTVPPAGEEKASKPPGGSRARDRGGDEAP